VTAANPPRTAVPARPAPAVAPRTNRGIELAFVVAAALVVACAEAIVEITRDNRLTSHVASYAAVVLVIGLVSHLAIRRWARYADPLMLPCALLLAGLGLVMIHRLDLGLAQEAAENGTRYSGQAAASQVVWAFLALAVFLVVLVVVRDHRVLSRPVQRGERCPDLDPAGRLLHPAG
jgi:hypothetical protein